MSRESEDGYIIEYVTHGNSVKVTAIDPETGIEACIIGAAGAAPSDLAQLAIRKLHYVLEKK